MYPEDQWRCISREICMCHSFIFIALQDWMSCNIGVLVFYFHLAPHHDWMCECPECPFPLLSKWFRRLCL